MYSAEIRDEFGDVESAVLCATVSEVARFYEEHGINFYGHGNPVTFKQYETGNIIARYTYTHHTPEQEHYFQVGLGNLSHCDTEHNIGYTFENCPVCQPAEYPMIEGEGAPQYTFALPAEPVQLALL